MSNQFNYDLDERQIKIMLQNAELEYNEEAWSNFELLQKTEPKTVNVAKIPTINFGISRSVIVPIIFIVLIGGFSSILFSFVDFKKKPEVIKEIPLVVTPYVKPKVVEKPVVTKPISINTPSLNIEVAGGNTLTAENPQSNSDISKQTTNTNKPEIIAKEIQKVDVNTSKTNSVANNPINNEVVTKSENVPLKKKTKQRKVKSEELPIITTPINNLNENTVEPELKLP